MQLTNRTEYAMRFLLYLGARFGKPVKVATASKAENIPKQFLSQIIGDLKKAGIIYSFRGPNGGIKLAKNPATITVMDVVSAIEGSMALYKCLEQEDFCDKTSYCPLCGFWVQTQEQIKEIFRRTSVADLVTNSKNYIVKNLDIKNTTQKG